MKNLALIFLFVGLLGVSFSFGVRMGGNAAISASAKYESELAVIRIGMIESGQIEMLRGFLKVDVDQFFITHVKTKNGLLNVYFPELKDPDGSTTDEIVAYLSDHPLEAPSEKLLEDLGALAEVTLIDYQKAQDYINDYGK